MDCIKVILYLQQKKSDFFALVYFVLFKRIQLQRNKWHFGGTLAGTLAGTLVALWWHFGGTLVALWWHFGGTLVALWLALWLALWWHFGGTLAGTLVAL